MRSKFLLSTALAFAAAFLPHSLVEAFPSYQATIPNGDVTGSVKTSAFGHTSDNGKSAFGLDYLASRDSNGGNADWINELCEKDSDNDGFTNGQELGDPNCIWTPGATPEGEFLSDPSDSACTPDNPCASAYAPHLLIHMLFMFGAWGLCAPVAIFMAMTQKYTGASWFPFHRNLMATNLGCNVAGLISVLSQKESFSLNTELAHANVGIIVFVAAIVMVLMGVFRPHKHKGEPKSTERKAFEIVHPWLGRFTFAGAVYNVGVGFELLFFNGEGEQLKIAFWVIMICLMLVGAVLAYKRSRPEAGNSEPTVAVKLKDTL